ncbi:MAG: phage GP46 family protein [Piscinibacter sp.]|uniref:phage GP46 family protein n=1 Tax=Piscinibacter sp. TaxID=1903157 RepID=UPI002583D198|nr:phage GP46 family protein [Piscinibacter sp.]MCW5666468.1 phage GP46 family protein [Piscinibacter sp.]
MSDLRTWFRDFAGDLQVEGAQLDEDDGLETAVVLSLFTDRRANDDDALPDSAGQAERERRGWWGDSYAEVTGDRIGSRLWLLSREKQLASVLERARQYADEALRWLVEDGVAREVTVSAEVVRSGVLGLQVEIVRPRVPVSRFRFETFWKGA